MTAQAPYESLREVVEALATACRDGLIRNTSDEDTVGVLEDAARAALAALPERAPVSAGGDAAFADWLAHEMPPGTIIGDPRWWAPRIARTLRRLATPAQPVGADWVVVPREAENEMMMEGVRAAQSRRPNSEGMVGHAQVRAAWDAMIAAAPTPAWRGVVWGMGCGLMTP